MTTPETNPPELLIEAGKAEVHYWKDVLGYHELLGFLAWRDIKVRYKQMTLGVAWVVIQPLVQTLLLSLIFGRLAKMPSGTLPDSAGALPYPLLVFVGLVPWQLFATAFSGAGGSMQGNSHLISKVYFPRLIMPLSALAVALVDFGVTLVLAFAYAGCYGLWPGWRLLALPLFALLALAVALGAGLWITALTVKYRDFRFITPFILQIGYFVTPVGFRTDSFGPWRDLLSLNPLTSVVEGFRWCFFGGAGAVYLPGLCCSLAVSLLLLASGVWYFRRTERSFADIL